MTVNAVIKELKSLGKEHTRKIYARHCISGAVYGVSYADLAKLQKRIKVDQALAEELWKTGSYEARVLATKIADANAITVKTLEGWVRDQENDAISGAISEVAARHPKAESLIAKWIARKNEWTTITGWATLSRYVLEDNDLGDDVCTEYLDQIRDTIHESTNWQRYAMNNALIAIGIRNAALKKKAVAAAKRIGKVEVDHGETSCKTPDAIPYMEKAWNRREQKNARKKAS